jgi:uncharacterized protein YbaA (DUF1428 family)
MEHGALEYHECVADDVKPDRYPSFPQAVRLKPGEEVWFCWAVHKSRKHRGPGGGEGDGRSAPGLQNMPFDGKRMFWGGFMAMVSA